MRNWVAVVVLLVISQYASTGLSDEVETTKINQLVVVYAPSYDPGGDFSPLYPILEPLLQTAEAHKLRVVLYPADLPDTEEGKVELKRKLLGLVKDGSSWVYLAAHGRSVPNPREAKDTLLGLPGKTLISELAPFLNHKNVKGTILSACEAFTEAARNTNNVICASSFPGRLSNLNHDALLVNSLRNLIGAGPSDPAKTLSGELVRSLKAQPDLQAPLIKDEGDKSYLPIAESPIPKKYLFEGEKYEVVDENGEKIEFCPVDILRDVADVTGTLADHAYLIRNVRYMLPGVHPIKPQSAPNSDVYPAFRCTKGKWVFMPPKECHGIETTIQDCESSQRVENKWFGKVDTALWKVQCEKLRSEVKVASEKGIEFPNRICLTGCVDNLLPTNNLVQTAPTVCSPGGAGRRCMLNLYYAPMSFMKWEKECCGTKFPKTYKWNDNVNGCAIRCYDSKKDIVAKPGECLVSELPLSMTKWGEFATDTEAIWECTDDGISLTPKCCNALPNRIYRGGECQYLSQKPSTHHNDGERHGE
jgi:hypothetical protein